MLGFDLIPISRIGKKAMGIYYGTYFTPTKHNNEKYWSS